MTPTYPTDQERVEAHEEAGRAHDYAHKQIGKTNLIGVLHELAAQVHWLASETRSLRLEEIAMHAVTDELVPGQMVGGEFVPDPEVLDEVPEGRWAAIGQAGDLAFDKGSTAGFPRDYGAMKLTRVDGAGEVFVTADAWARHTGMP